MCCNSLFKTMYEFLRKFTVLSFILVKFMVFPTLNVINYMDKTATRQNRQTLAKQLIKLVTHVGKSQVKA